METKYISIADFAERAGVSRQTVYNNLPKDLRQFTKTIDNKKVISEAALEVFPPNVSNENLDTPMDKPLTAEERLVSWLEAELERVNCQLDLTMQKLDLTMQMLRSEQDKNTTLQEQILKLSNEFCEITKQSNVLVSQAQQLQALQAPKPEPEPVAAKKKGLLSKLIKNNRGN